MLWLAASPWNDHIQLIYIYIYQTVAELDISKLFVGRRVYEGIQCYTIEYSIIQHVLKDWRTGGTCLKPEKLHETSRTQTLPRLQLKTYWLTKLNLVGMVIPRRSRGSPTCLLPPRGIHLLNWRAGPKPLSQVWLLRELHGVSILSKSTSPHKHKVPGGCDPCLLVSLVSRTFATMHPAGSKE